MDYDDIPDDIRNISLPERIVNLQSIIHTTKTSRESMARHIDILQYRISHLVQSVVVSKTPQQSALQQAQEYMRVSARNLAILEELLQKLRKTQSLQRP